MPSTNFLELARVRETVIGVTPASPKMEVCYVTGESLKIAKRFIRDDTITGDRRVKAHEAVGIAVEGGGNANWAFGYHDWALELGLNDSFLGLAEAYNATAASAITDIDSTGQEVTADGDWVEGMLIELSGLDDPSNNVSFAAAAGTTADSIIAPPGTLGADDASPAAGARAYCYGYQGASADISATATGLASASNAFAGLPLVAGQTIKIGGTAAGLQFGTSALNDFAVIDDIAADGSSITLAEKPAGWTTDSGAGKTIQLFIGDHAADGETVLTDTLQKRNTKLLATDALKYVGVAMQTLGFQMALNDAIRQTATVIGFTGGLLTSLLDSSPSAPIIGAGDLLKTGSNFARLSEGGAAIAAGHECQRLNWTLNNNLTPVGDLTKDYAIDYDPGDMDVRIEADYRFGSKAIYEKFLNEDLTSQFFVVKRGAQAYAGRLASGKYTDGGVVNQAKNGQLIATMVLEGSKHPTTGKLIDLTRFRRWF